MNDEPFDYMKAITESVVPAVVGRATIAWNNISYSLYELFKLISELDPETAKSVFFCVASDRSQRDMVSAMVANRLKPLDPRLAKAAQTQIGAINAIAGKRNDILHIVFVDDHSPDSVKPFNKRGMIKDQTGHELLDDIHKLTMECLDVAHNLLCVVIEAQKLPHYRAKVLAEAVRTYNARQKLGERPNPGGFGLLDFPATIPPTPEEGQGQ